MYPAQLPLHGKGGWGTIWRRRFGAADLALDYLARDYLAPGLFGAAPHLRLFGAVPELRLFGAGHK